MYVRNSAGFVFSFKYRDVVIVIPYDGKIYSIPDDVEIEKYNQLKVVLPMNVRTQEVTYIRKDGEIASEHLMGHKRRDKSKREEPKPPKEEPKETFIVDVDIDDLDGVEKKVVEKPKVKRIIKRPTKRAKPKK